MTVRTLVAGACSFSEALPVLWNRLSLDVKKAQTLHRFQRIFKANLFCYPSGSS